MRVVVLLCVLALPLIAQMPEGASLEIRVQEVTGEVEYQAAPKTAWKTAQVGDLLPVGAKLCTGVESSAALAFGTNSVALLREASLLDINAFGMQGDQLVAQVMIDPGVCTVSFKQLATFQTDFQVSTPRLTASVRGTIVTTIANGGFGDKDDSAAAEQNSIIVDLLNGMSNTVAQGGSVTQNNLDVGENALADAVFNAVDGLAANEQSPDQLNNVGQNIGVDAGSLTGVAGNPVQNVAPAPQEPPIQDLTIRLTWDPIDLDLHYLTGAFHVQRTDLTSPDGSVVHSGDDRVNVLGEEGILVRGPQQPNSTALVYVQNFDWAGGSGTPIADTLAQLTVQDNTGAVNQTIAVNPGAPNMEFWKIVEIQYGPNSEATVVPIDQHTNTDPAGQ